MKNTALITSYGRLLSRTSRFITMFIPGRVICVLVFAALSGAQEPASQPTTPLPLMLSPADKNKVIYVSDFDVDSKSFKHDKGGITGKGFIIPPPPGLVRKSKDPADEAQKLIRLMSEPWWPKWRRPVSRRSGLRPATLVPRNVMLLSGISRK